jgi:prepilin-type N-terminal cleavage/methylation domain-containing protein
MQFKATPKMALKNLRAFTLIELLVVIAIIAILAGLLFPAAQSALNSAKKTTAKNQIVQIATAITAYETEYGKLPSDQAYTNASPALVAMLCTTNDSVNNPRAIIFMEASSWKQGKGGTNSSGAFCDPFSNTNVYSVALDTNYANTLSFSVNGTTTNLTKHIAVWSTPLVGKTNVLINSWD